MGASLTDVANDALGLIGEDPIAGLDDGTTKANRCNVFLLPLVDDVLRRHDWNCAHFLATLALTTAPAFGYTNAFQLPGDPYCLRVLTLNQSEQITWKVRGRTLHTDDSVAEIEFTGRVSDPTLWDSTLYQAMIYCLASKLAGAILHDPKMQTVMYQTYEQIMLEGTTIDSQEGSQDAYSAPEFVLVRGG